MLAQEMHIQFGLGFQKLGANSRRKFYPEEVDALLNRSMDQFIADQVKITTDAQGFEQMQVDVDKIRPLIVRDAIVPAYIDDIFNGVNKFKSMLPGDYAYLISDSWHLSRKCASTTTGSDTLSITQLKMPETAKASAPFYAGLSLVATNMNIDVPTKIPFSLYTGLASKKDKYQAINLVLELFNEEKKRTPQISDYNLYWEKAPGYYTPGSFILVKPNADLVTLTVDGTVQTSSTSTSVLSRYASASGLYDRYSSRLTKTSVIDNLLTIPFYKPMATSPLSTLVEGMFYVYTPASHIVNKVSLSYIRKAARINLSLQRNCELAPEFHQYIVDKAVEYAAGRVENPNLYQVAATENKP